jgi:outer membrane receptor protein involved in Fe transport
MTRTYGRFDVKTLALSISTVLFTVPLISQGADAPLEEIQVTGSRIRLTDGMAQPTPVTAVTIGEMRDFDPSSSVSEQLDNLPQFLNTQTAQRGGGTLFGDAAGSYLNLRNMGKQRTLVLFDGSRVVPADRAGVPNVDNFPTALIRNVDVVTGGASAAYGADAMAGVVNFVLDREFEGFKSSVSTGITERGDGFNYNFSIAGGALIGERLHLIGSLEHRNIDQILRDPQDLDNWNSIGWVINPAWKAADPPGTNPQRLTLPHVHQANQNPAGLVSVSGPLANQFKFQNYTFTEDGRAMRPFVQGDYRNLGNGMQAGGPEAAIAEHAFDGGGGLSGNEVIQHSAFGGFKYDFTDSTNVFGQIMLGRTESNSYDRRGNPEMGAIYTATVFRENAFLPPELAAEMDRLGLAQVNFAKIGQVRTGTNKNFYDDRDSADIAQMWSASAGFEHLFKNDWSLRGNYQYGESKLTSEAEGIIRVDHWFLAMDAVRDPATGSIVCNVQLRNPTIAELEAAAVGKSVMTTRVTEFPSGKMPIDNILVTPERSIRDCQPLNVFGLGNASQAADDYLLSDDKKGIRDLDQHFAELLLTGDLFDGWGAGPVSFAGGLTWRKEWFNQITRPIDFERTTLNAPEVGIRGIPSQISEGNRSIHQFSATSWATGSFDVWEWFTELNVPIWAADSGNQRLDTNFAFRQSDYSHSGKIDSWKIGAELQLLEDLRLRVTQSRDVREPTFQEQFEAQGGGGQVNDPVMGINNQTVTLLTYGNPNLSPEEADTLTAGLVYAPTFADWVDGLQFSVDYYDIDVAGRITPLGAQRLVDECSNGSSPAFCSQLVRNPDTNILERVEDRQVNAAAGVTRGVDFEARYAHEVDFIDAQPEDVNFRLFANKALENSVTTTTYRDDVGSLTSPKWNATAVFGYNLGNAGLNWITRYYDSTTYTNGFGVFWLEGIDVDDASIASQTIHNVVLSYRGETASGANWVASLNVNNLFDRDPPVVASQSTRGGQQNPSNVFDVFGRRYQISLNYNF